MSVSELLRQRAERGEARGGDQVWHQAVSTAGPSEPLSSGRRGRLLAAAGLVALAAVGAFLLLDRLDDDPSALVVRGDPPAPSEDAASAADAASTPTDPCAGQVVVINATASPGVASEATALLRARIEASRAAIGTTRGADIESLGPSPVADPHQGAQEVDESVVLLPSTSCPALENLAAELHVDVSYRGDWPEEYRSVLDSPEIQIGAHDVVVILGRELPPPIADGVVVVPDVVGLLADRARLALEQQGFVIVMTFVPVEEGLGDVRLQTPPSGRAAPVGSTVELVVGEAIPATPEQPDDGPESDQAATVDGRLDLDEVVILPCDGPVEPFKSGDVASPISAATPIGALTAYVSSWVSTPDQPNNMPSDRWLELSLPDGRFAYGWNAYNDDDSAPEEFNIVLWLESDSSGWFVSRWESSGC